MTDATPSSAVADFMARHAAYQQRAATLHTTNKAALFAVLTAAGVTRVTVSFDGFGDSGQIEDIEAMAGETKVSLPTSPVEILQTASYDETIDRREQPIAEAIETLVYSFLEETHSGWENNEGAFGQVVFDVAADTITLEYNERFESSEYCEHAF